MRQSLVAGNWKMHGSQSMARELVPALVGALRGVEAEIVVCPPFPFLPLACDLLKGSSIALGAQDLHTAESGACTGDVSGPMLRDVGCTWVIVGHSERRAGHDEQDVLVADKALAALRAGLRPIVCVGETARQRESGQALRVVAGQFAALLARLGPGFAESLTLAYEPVWAIGTGVTASPEQAQEMHHRLRAQAESHAQGLGARMRLLYGGSVKAANAAELFGMPDIDGGLIGSASLDAGEFVAICRAAEGMSWNK